MNKFPKDWILPKFSIEILSSRSTKYALVIPVINEGERIKNELEKIHVQGISSIIDVIIADGGTTDGSLDRDFLKANNVKTLLVKEDTGKLSAQLRMAYAWVLNEGYEGIITIDGNDKDSVESISAFIEELDAGIDYVQASRFINGGKSINIPFIRLIAIRLIHAPLTSLSARKWLTDTTQGFRAYSRQYLLDSKVLPFRECFKNYELLAYLSVRASQLGYKVKEIPTTRAYPNGGKIPTKISPIAGSIELLKVLFNACLGFYKP